jgi:hypothetical protein
LRTYADVAGPARDYLLSASEYRREYPWMT